MRDFALSYPYFPNLQAASAKLENTKNQYATILQAPLAKLSWYHHTTLLDKVKDAVERQFYIQETILQGWSRDVMVHQIDSSLYSRKGQIINNFTQTIESEKSELIQQVFKDPYKFDFIYLGREAKERDLEDALTNQLTKFLIELGKWFSFMGRQNKIMLGENEYFIDLLFYHTRLKRYIVIDLKIDEFKPEYKGKMEFYLTLADEQLKSAGDEPSIGLILCKTKDGLVAEYALRDGNKPIGIAEYKISESLPENIKGEMPTIDELEAEIDREYEELKSPSEKRFDSLKEKLAQIKNEEIKQAVTPSILFEIIDKSLLPLYETLIKRLEDFKEWFYSSSYEWERGINNINQLAEKWNDETFLKHKFDFYFTYHFSGFKKAGTETFNKIYSLNLKIDTYWYGFVFNQQIVLKKLYHQQLTISDIEKIARTVYDYVMDDIEMKIGYLNKE